MATKPFKKLNTTLDDLLGRLKSQKMYLYSAKEVRRATSYQIRQSIASFLTLYSSAKGGVVHEGVKRLSKGNQIAISVIY